MKDSAVGGSQLVMSSGNSYRLHSDSLAIRTSNDGKRHTITVPSGTTVAIVEGPVGGRRLVEIDWNGEKVLIFADDLEHSEESYFSDERTLRRGTHSNEAEGREQALIEHSMDLANSNLELERFAFVAAHDLREPLRSIQGVTQMLLDRNRRRPDAEAARLLKVVLTSTHRMMQLIHDLLNFATLGQEAEIAEVDTESVARLALRELEKTVTESGATVSIRPLPPVQANGDQLLRLFENLVGNAIKYRSEESPQIHISSSFVDGELIFSVADNGIGIEPEYHEQIFHPFRRLHGTSEYEGSGVGLAICKRVVDLHSGRIWVESQPGQGSTFYFTIPDAGSPKAVGSVESVKPKSIRTVSGVQVRAAAG